MLGPLPALLNQNPVLYFNITLPPRDADALRSLRTSAPDSSREEALGPREGSILELNFHINKTCSLCSKVYGFCPCELFSHEINGIIC